MDEFTHPQCGRSDCRHCQNTEHQPPPIHQQDHRQPAAPHSPPMIVSLRLHPVSTKRSEWHSICCSRVFHAQEREFFSHWGLFRIPIQIQPNLPHDFRTKGVPPLLPPFPSTNDEGTPPTIQQPSPSSHPHPLYNTTHPPQYQLSSAQSRPRPCHPTPVPATPRSTCDIDIRNHQRERYSPYPLPEARRWTSRVVNDDPHTLRSDSGRANGLQGVTRVDN